MRNLNAAPHRRRLRRVQAVRADAPHNLRYVYVAAAANARHAHLTVRSPHGG